MKHAKQPCGGIPAYHVRLVSESQETSLGLRELWRYRYLVLLLTKKAFTMTYQQTVLGPLWIIIHPAFTALVHMLVFGNIAQIGTGNIPQVLFYFFSAAVWELFSFSLTSNAGTFISNSNLFSKVYFPRLAVPFSNMLVSMIKFAIQLIIIIPLMVFFSARGDIHPIPAGFLLLPLLFLQMSMLGMSVGVLLSGLTTKYRDLMHLVNVGVSLWMYGSAVVYPLSSVPQGALRSLIELNPATQIMELSRMIMLGEGEYNLLYCLIGLVLTVLMFLLATIVFNRVERTFEDTI